MATQESGPTSAYNKGIRSILTEDPYPLRCILGQSSNPLTATRQPKTVIEALKKLDLYIVMDTEWNSSCDYADYVLPACSNYETSQQFATKNSKAGTWTRRRTRPFRSRSPSPGAHRTFDRELADRMGYGDDFWHGDFDECLREQLDGSGFTLEELREKGSVAVERTEEFTPEEPVYQNYEELFNGPPQRQGPVLQRVDRQQAELRGGRRDFPAARARPVRPRATTARLSSLRSTRWSSRTSTPTACATTA